MSGHNPQGSPPASKPPMTSMPPMRVIIPAEDAVFLVISAPEGGISGAYLDGALALRVARDAGAVVCKVPLLADFRARADGPQESLG